MNAPVDLRDSPDLRVLTCGSVDDGKSTLIGRLLYEKKLIFDDQLSALEKDSKKFGTTEDVDFALLVDGLEAEREQGITIDVAYRYFATETRSFIVADTPGHEQYTRNMATGASNADVAIVLVDARKGLLTQTHRHSIIVSLLGVRHVVLAVNKIDLVDYDERVFREIAADYRKFAETLGFRSLIRRADLGALRRQCLVGQCADAVVLRAGICCEARNHRGRRGSPKRALSVCPCNGSTGRISISAASPARFRAAGSREASRSSPPDPAARAPSSHPGRATRRWRAAEAGDAVTLTLADEVDIARGDVLVESGQPPGGRRSVHGASHMDERRADAARPFLPAQDRRADDACVRSPNSSTASTSTLSTSSPRKSLDLNEVGFCNIATTMPVAFDPYVDNRETGGFHPDRSRQTNETAAAGMIAHGLRRATNVHRHGATIDREAHAALKHQKPAILWFTGLSGAGKSTIANLVEAKLHARGVHTTLLDGDNVRHGLNKDLGFTAADRVENIRRVGEVARLMTDAGLIVLCSFISPFRAERRLVRDTAADGRVSGDLRRYAARDGDRPRSQGPVQASAGRRDQELHRRRSAL